VGRVEGEEQRHEALRDVRGSAHVFRDPLARIFADPPHSSNEPRELIIGHSGNRRLFVVSFTEREGRVRIISARRATKREQQDYEQNSK